MSTSNRGTRAHGPLVVSLALLAAAPGRGTAQLPVQLDVFVAAGIHHPTGDLPAAPILTSDANIVSFGDLGPAPVLAGGVEIRPGGSPVSLRVSGQRSLYRNETGNWGCAPNPDGTPVACPELVGLFETRLAMTAAVADVVLDLRIEGLELRPLVGLGWVRHSYRWDQRFVGAFSLAPNAFDVSAPALHAGVGLRVPVRTIHVEAAYSELYTRPSASHPSRTGSATLGVFVPVR